MAPVYFIYLLKNYCISKKFSIISVFEKLFLLGSVVIIVFLFTFIPFYDHLGQVCIKIDLIQIKISIFRYFQECSPLKGGFATPIGPQTFGLFTIH